MIESIEIEREGERRRGVKERVMVEGGREKEGMVLEYSWGHRPGTGER